MTEILRASERTGACPAANALPHMIGERLDDLPDCITT